MYHLDRKLDIPSKLDSWATKRSQVYLAIHATSVLSVDTVQTTWRALTQAQSIATPWTTVGHKQRSGPKQSQQKSKHVQMVLPFKRASSVLGELATPTIMEEGKENDSTASNNTSNKASPVTASREGRDNLSQASSQGKMSALIPNLNVPLNDGTHRITIRWKTTIEFNNSAQQADVLNRHIYDLLNELFSDDDGLLYKWGRDDLDHFNSISKMTPEEVRAFISPTIAIIPSQSLVIIPIRFGFSGMTPSHWRNKNVTKMTLDRLNLTLSTSNSKTTSGKLVVCGYILLKAPMTTHRIRYLQSLRSVLPETTPHFDILLHRTTPLGQKINHLVVQCGEKHVHPLSQALLTVLTGYRSPVYIPRFAFADMSTEQATKLFETHDQYIKALRSISLFPMLTNLDTLRTEHFPDGNTLVRSTRDWATSIMSIDGTESAKCDVVNGGLDQKAYLLFPPQFEEAARLAFEEYRRRIFPSLKKPVFATVLDHQTLKTISAQRFPDSTDTTIASAQSSLNRPPTPLESLRHRYNSNATLLQRERRNYSHQRYISISGFIRKFFERRAFQRIESKITRQQKDLHKSNKYSTDKLQQIEDHLQSKLDEVKHDVSIQLTALEKQLITSMQQQVHTGDSMKAINEKIERLTDAVALLLRKTSSSSPPAHDTSHSHRSNNDYSSTLILTQNPDGDESMKTSSTGSSAQEVISSPQHKKQRPLHSEGDDHIDDMVFGTPDSSDRNPEITSPNLDGGPSHSTSNDDSIASSSISQSADQSHLFPPETIAPTIPNPLEALIPHLADITADLEARYNYPNAPGGGKAT
ncbi:hypothetical protein MHU86_24303 [Fragilaria crotonensis]|nr:hypothetical protein MHU86_24303 [Fragilaria crotonensis]